MDTNVRAHDPIVYERWRYFDPNLMIGDMAANQRRYDFRFWDISIMDTSGGLMGAEGADIAPNDVLAPGDNLIRLYIAEVPEDMPDQLPVFRVADCIINYRNGNRHVYLYPADFQLLE
jgi:hypothetical protein